MKRVFISLALTACWLNGIAQQMNTLWGEQTAKPVESVWESLPLKQFRDGNYAMFVHWGLYSSLGGVWKGKTYYGIGEWLMSKSLADIPADEYKKCARNFNPSAFDAKELVRLAKEAGMKYIVITSKHHDGFAMYHTRYDDFNIVDTTPFARDPMKELAEECRKQNLGFGFYYSQTQDWTAPGGFKGPQKDANGKVKTFDDYFREKCIPQVKEICTRYGDISLVWFDTPANISKENVSQLIDTVRAYQPHALISGRVGFNMGDYRTLGDMEIPAKNRKGLWEAIDVTNDSWGYVWYDQNWKTPKEVLTRLLSTVARGGTYMLNVGPKPDGSLPEQAVFSLKKAGEWIHKYPQTVYGAEASPFGIKMPWGDVVRKDGRLYLLIYDWPADNKLHFYGLNRGVQKAYLLKGDEKQRIKHDTANGWTTLQLPSSPVEAYVNVVELHVDKETAVSQALFLSPNGTTTLGVSLGDNVGNRKAAKSWMEKFGEWKYVTQINKWGDAAKAVWEVQVMRPGYYQVALNYSGKGRLVWKVQADNKEVVQNQLSASTEYVCKSLGWMHFNQQGKYRIEVSLVDGDREITSLEGIRFTAIE